MLFNNNYFKYPQHFSHVLSTFHLGSYIVTYSCYCGAFQRGCTDYRFIGQSTFTKFTSREDLLILFEASLNLILMSSFHSAVSIFS